MESNEIDEFYSETKNVEEVVVAYFKMLS